MKKAKIMLSALGVLAIVGSALAFKAHKTYGGNLRCSTITTDEFTNQTLPAAQCRPSTYTTTATTTGTIRFCAPLNNPTAPCAATTYVTFSL
jgi:hypothetical protein